MSHNPVTICTLDENGDPQAVDWSVKTIISRHLDSNGDGTGTKNINGNYATPTRFYIQPATDETYIITRMLVMIEDTTGFQAEEYGNLGAALTNGIFLQKATDGVQDIDYMDGINVKINADWGRMCYDVDLKTWGAGDEIIVARWTFSASGTSIKLKGSELESLDIVVNDNLTGLISHYYLVQGYIL